MVDRGERVPGELDPDQESPWMVEEFEPDEPDCD